jgi:hypothetical protein
MVRGTVEAVGPFGLVAIDFEGRTLILEVPWSQLKVGDVLQTGTLSSSSLLLKDEASSCESKGRVVAFDSSPTFVQGLLADAMSAAGARRASSG